MDNIPGLCGEHTQEKQDIFSKFVEHHINIVKQIYNKKGQWNPYLYFDVFAGPGWMSCQDYEGPGSPLIFKRIMSSFEGINYRMICSENNPDYQVMLTDVLEDFELKDNALECCPKSYHEWHFGMAYIDPPMSKDSFLLLEQIIKDFAKYFPQLDIVLHISASYIKRLSGMNHVPFDKKLTEFMNCVNKDWVIRESIGKQQYTFLVGTDYLSWALWKNQGFYKVNSYDGQRILKRLNYKQDDPIFETFGLEQGKFF